MNVAHLAHAEHGWRRRFDALAQAPAEIVSDPARAPGAVPAWKQHGACIGPGGEAAAGCCCCVCRAFVGAGAGAGGIDGCGFEFTQSGVCPAFAQQGAARLCEADAQGSADTRVEEAALRVSFQQAAPLNEGGARVVRWRRPWWPTKSEGKEDEAHTSAKG
ncbi:MAG: hypothetical protein IPG56_07005 [Caulobacteraceae bacterium]|nr:hypothetical protein [Caulobacteraceae bacterium]